jgi:hypothetical protein
MQTRQSGLEGTGAIRLRDLVKESLRMQTAQFSTSYFPVSSLNRFSA